MKINLFKLNECDMKNIKFFQASVTHQYQDVSTTQQIIDSSVQPRLVICSSADITLDVN